ncbi:hypothetical protein BHM03_00056867 [Ensete ventricosum]|nr:hypothetical protein BHM03_00056867 [Ensete ventricosum]
MSLRRICGKQWEERKMDAVAGTWLGGSNRMKVAVVRTATGDGRRQQAPWRLGRLLRLRPATVAGRHGRKAALEDKGRWWPGREGSGEESQAATNRWGAMGGSKDGRGDEGGRQQRRLGAARDSDRGLAIGEEEAAAGGRGEDSDGRREKAVAVAGEGCDCGYFLEEETRAAVAAAGGRAWEQKASAAGERRRGLVQTVREGKSSVGRDGRWRWQRGETTVAGETGNGDVAGQGDGQGLEREEAVASA